jgi:hypothetical protein
VAIGRRALELLDEGRRRRPFTRAALPAVLPAVVARREARRLMAGEAVRPPAILPMLLAMGWAAGRRRV